MAKKKKGYVELEWTCPNCENENGGAVRICGTCGTPQPDDVEFHQPRQQELVTDEDKLAKARAGADVHCGYCEARNPATAKSCSQCGGDLSEGAQRKVGKVVGAFKPGPAGSVECDNCGSHNAATRTICHNCGASLPVKKQAAQKVEKTADSKSSKKGLSGAMIVAILVGCIGICGLTWFVFFRTTEVVGKVVAVEWN
ncbi:MAG: zinc ribbon domain-containing protein, partial [Chloroflexota bacterium]